MTIVNLDGLRARCSARGVERDVSLLFLEGEDLKPGDHVMVHKGEALQRMTAAEAEDAWRLYEQILELQEGSNEITSV